MPTWTVLTLVKAIESFQAGDERSNVRNENQALVRDPGIILTEVFKGTSMKRLRGRSRIELWKEATPTVFPSEKGMQDGVQTGMRGPAASFDFS